MRDLESLAPLFDTKGILITLLSDIIRILRRRSEELVLVVRFLAVANRVDRVLRTMKLHLDAVWPGLGGPEANEAEGSDVTRVLANTILLIYIDPVLRRGSVVHA